MPKWVEWVFSGIGVAVVVGLFAWLRSMFARPRVSSNATSSLAVGADASLRGPTLVGSNNTQVVMMNPQAGPTEAAQIASRSLCDATREMQWAAWSFFSLHTQYGVARAARDIAAEED